MINVAVCSIANILLTLVARLLQKQSPFRINLNNIREYDPPFCSSVNHMKILFAVVVVYMGLPISFFINTSVLLSCVYCVYWYFTVLWWHHLAKCHFESAYHTSLRLAIALFTCMSYFFYAYEEAVFAWTLPLWWTMYTLYVSIYYKEYHAKLNFISS